VTSAFATSAFEADLREVLDTPDAPPWQLTRTTEGLGVIATIAHDAEPKDSYQVRLLWSTYPDHAPSLKFLDPTTGRDDVPTAWPNGSPFRPQNLDACTNYCAEGFAVHPEWRQDAQARWSAEGNVLLKVLRNVQHDVDFRSTGRFHQ